MENINKIEINFKIGDTVRFVCNRMDDDGSMTDSIMKVTGKITEIEKEHSENTLFPKYHIKRNGKMYWYSGDNLQLIKRLTTPKTN